MAAKTLPPLAIAPFDPTEAKNHQEAWARFFNLPVEAENKIGMKLILIPPASVVLPKAYYLGKYEVTQGEWEHVMGYNPSQFGPQNPKVAGLDLSKFPVEKISWFDCVEFCNILSEREGLKPYYELTVSKRGGKDGKQIDEAEVKILGGDGYHIPTEAEWQHGSAAGAKTKYHFGDKDEDITEFDWIDENSDGRTHVVGEKMPNPFGLYDLYGNVREWVETMLPNEKTGVEDRNSRGGSWHYPRANWNSYQPPNHRGFGHAGLRVARVPSGVPALTLNAPLAPFTDADVARIAALPAEQQIEEVRKELVRRNPGFDGNVGHKLEDGVVTEIKVVTDHVTDIAPLRVFNSLKVLDLSGTETNYRGNGRLADLSPLKGMDLSHLTRLALLKTNVGDAGMELFQNCTNLTGLVLQKSPVGDAGINHFKNCKKLTSLDLGGTSVTDRGLAAFQNCADLQHLWLSHTAVGDEGLAYFKDCKKLGTLFLGGTKVDNTGLRYFENCPNVRRLTVNLTAVTDHSLLKNWPLKDLALDFQSARDTDILRSIPTLETINGKPAAEFWREVDVGKTPATPAEAAAPAEELPADPPPLIAPKPAVNDAPAEPTTTGE